MKIISWNCNGAFRHKNHLLDDLDFDIAIIQECENPATHLSKIYSQWSLNYHWVGLNKNKGLGVFAKPNIILEKLTWQDDNLKYFLPVRVNNTFDLVACWCHGANSPTFGYIGQLWKYLQINKNFLNHSIIIGDLNSNKRWDVWDRWWNHSDIVRELEQIDIRSLYHEHFNESQGEEKLPTFYLQKKIDKAYHIDYAFAPRTLINRYNISIGERDKWIKYSDHMPVFIEW